MTNIDDLMNKGKTLFDNARYDQAIEVYKRALEIEPNNVDILIEIGLSHRQREEYTLAIEYYDKALELDEKNKIALNNKGYAFECMSDLNNAKIYYIQSLEVDPSYDNPLVNLTKIYNDNQEYEKSIELFKKALEKDHLNVANWIDLGRTYRQLELYDEAIQAYIEAIKLAPNDKICWNNIGWVYYCIENYDKAIEAFTKSMEIDWIYDLPYSNLIKIYKKMKKEQNENYIVWKNIANGFHVGRAYNRAIDAINRALTIKPGFEEALKLRKKIVKAKTKYDGMPDLERKIEETLVMFSQISMSALVTDIVGYIKFHHPGIGQIYIDDEIKFKIFEIIQKKGLAAKLDADKLNFFPKGYEERGRLTI